MKLVGVSGTLAGNKTSQAVHEVLTAATAIDSNIQTELIDLREYEVEFCRGEPLTYYNEDTWNVVKKIVDADFIVFGTPIYQASISGVLKNLLDFFPEYAFKNKVTGIIATGGSEKHFLVPENHLKPILSYLRGLVPSTHVFVHNDKFDVETDEIIDQKIASRIQNLAEEMVFLQRSINNRKNTNKKGDNEV
ncbi:NADPH-dependent FMN reductase [Ornithinibacillus bavariensis]|uniref:NAD(P)H-dependent oxidoreductase n=1 Tax=Ornithinibacillus bavariensis TaxID=545502 RepID=A0A920C5E2_9BACI|nr:NAD(P)H-dependent oxidoreductase [Ornithinibacillus bavariensis]GIO25423.1 NAD(P)H-dependent oxidoreductase [Ornithinibacillus bavariensis]HAM80526.1 NADH-dependent FMN reductase [Ornithinibacillus sp.]